MLEHGLLEARVVWLDTHYNPGTLGAGYPGRGTLITGNPGTQAIASWGTLAGDLDYRKPWNTGYREPVYSGWGTLTTGNPGTQDIGNWGTLAGVP